MTFGALFRLLGWFSLASYCPPKQRSSGALPDRFSCMCNVRAVFAWGVVAFSLFVLRPAQRSGARRAGYQGKNRRASREEKPGAQ